jgi:uncharacterized delta-60 repeat protein
MTIGVIPPDAVLAAIVRQGDGKFMACGYETVGTGSSASNRILAARFLASGAPDPTFGNNGKAQIDGGLSSITIHACLELADGHFIFAGSAGKGEQQRAAAWRLSPDGALDPGFGSNGMALIDTATESLATSMLVMADGSLAIAGTQWQPDADWRSDNNAWGAWADMLVARIDPTSGDIDRGFGNQGATAIDFGTRQYTSNAAAASLRQQPDGKLVIVGSHVDIYDWYYAYSIAVARVDPYGPGSNGWASMTDTYAYVPTEGGEFTLRLRRTGGSTGALTVDYRTVAGTATAGEDYVDTGGTVTWPDGDLGEKTISITVLNDPLASDSERFKVELFNSSGGLGMDQAIIYISRTSPASDPPPSTGTPPSTGGSKNNVPAGSSGGGAIGIELWLLMVFAALAIAHRSRSPGNRR